MPEKSTKKSIVWIDDEIGLMASHIDILVDGIPECQLETFQFVDDGLKTIQETRGNIALIILDLMMPYGVDFSPPEKNKAEHGHLTGAVVLDRIKRTAPNIPVVAFTIIRDHELKKQLSSQLELYIEKPMDPVELVKIVREVLGYGTNPESEKGRYLSS